MSWELGKDEHVYVPMSDETNARRKVLSDYNDAMARYAQMSDSPQRTFRIKLTRLNKDWALREITEEAYREGLNELWDARREAEKYTPNLTERRIQERMEMDHKHANTRDAVLWWGLIGFFALCILLTLA
jgi:hypothetical protein